MEQMTFLHKKYAGAQLNNQLIPYQQQLHIILGLDE